jgi:hypothetical protein
MRGSPEFLTCDLSENRTKALPPSLLPRLSISIECMPNTNRGTDSGGLGSCLITITFASTYIAAAGDSAFAAQ